jgi:HSP20 family molecular chaperone IbpA
MHTFRDYGYGLQYINMKYACTRCLPRLPQATSNSTIIKTSFRHICKFMRPYLEEMADMPTPLFGYDAPPTFADHPHAREHQHMTYLQYLARKEPDQKNHPNYPDVDIRDAISHYLIELECPGVKDPTDIQCQWTSQRRLTVSGTTTRPEYVPHNDAESLVLMPGVCREKDIPALKDSERERPVYVVLGERRIGSFRRLFTFPVEVEHESMTARLEAGLLRIKVMKKLRHIPKGSGRVNIDVEE